MPFSKPVLAVAKALGMLPGLNTLFFFKSTQRDGVKTLSKINKSMFFPNFFSKVQNFLLDGKKFPKLLEIFKHFFNDFLLRSFE